MTRISIIVRLLLALTLSTVFLTACGTDSGSAVVNNDRNNNTGDSGDDDTPRVSNKYQAANQCFALKAGDNYIQQVGDTYGVTNDASEATAFFWKPTNLGTYLMLSSYKRASGEVGNKQLLGLADPMGNLLDTFGNFVGQVGILVSGVGDISEYFTNPIKLPLEGVIDGFGAYDSEDAPRIRLLGEGVTATGETLESQTIAPSLTLTTEANDLAVWALNDPDETDDDYRYTIQSNITQQFLTTEGGTLQLADAPNDSSLYEFIPAANCDEYPEAELGATFTGDNKQAIYMKDAPYFAEFIADDPANPAINELTGNEIYGWVDAHMHISAYEFIGGRINYGDPFHKFGVDHALHDCEENHGPQGMTGFVEHVTTTLGPHATQGWPSFDYWPRNNSLQHHQTYYKWMERAWLAGQKLAINHLVHNEILCQLNPQKQNDCDPMPAILLQAEKMHDMQDYIDAQYGGPGEGWFRIVLSAQEARNVIAQGKMAVILGVEMSKAMNCGEFQGVAQCTEAEMVQRLDRLYDAGVRSMFPVHKFDNAFAGHKPDMGNPVGIAGVLYAGNLGETGHPIEYEECPEGGHSGEEQQSTGGDYLSLPSDPNFDPTLKSLEQLGIIEQLLFQLDYLGQLFPSSPEEFAEYDPRDNPRDNCNVRGLTDLGEALVLELMKRNMLIEIDHISSKAAARILEITENAVSEGQHYPTVNSHGGWSHDHTRRRMAAQGGYVTDTDRGRGSLLRSMHHVGAMVTEQYKIGPFSGTAIASDVNGIANLTGDGGEIPATFYSLDGRVEFTYQQTGDKVFTLHEEGRRGVDHVGLYADLLSDTVLWAQRIINDPEDDSVTEESLKQAMGNLYSSAEAYIRMWERAEAYKPAQ